MVNLTIRCLLVRRRRGLPVSNFPTSLHPVALSNKGSVVKNLQQWSCVMERTRLDATFPFNAPRSEFSNRILYQNLKHPRLCGGLSNAAHKLSTYAEERADATEAAGKAIPVGARGAVFDYYSAIEVCEIIESNPWGPEIEEILDKLKLSFTCDVVAKVIIATSPNVAFEFFNWLTRNHFEHNAHTLGAIINSLGAAGSLDTVKGLIDELCKGGETLDSTLYDKLIYWCVYNRDAAGAIAFFEKMKQEGNPLAVSIYTSMIDVLAKDRRCEEAVNLYLQMVEEGMLPSSRTVKVLVRTLLEAGKLESAHRIFTMLSDLKIKPPMSTYAYLMAAHAKVGNMGMLQKLGKEMRESYNRPGKIFCAAFESLQKQGKAKEADSFAEMVWPELSVPDRGLRVQGSGNLLQEQETDEDDLLEGLGELASSFKGLQNSRTEYPVSTVSAKKVHVSLSDIAKLVEVEGLSALDQLKVDWSSDDTVHRMLRQFNRSDAAWEFFQWLKACSGFKHDIYNEIEMLRILARESKFSALKELLIEMQARSMVSLETFNALIKDSASAKSSKAAMWIFSRIKESNLQPNEETFKLLVNALARGKSPDKALELSALMQDLGIKHDKETYTAVIHSLGLAGSSDEAWSVYQKMLSSGLKPDAYTYTVLLNIMNSVGDNAFAIKLYKEMNDSGVAPTAVTQGIMAKVWRKAGNVAEAQKLDMQRKFVSSKKREDSLQLIYEILLEGLVLLDHEQSATLLF